MAGTAYDVLGVLPSADPARVRTAYRELAMRFHPDRWVGADPQTRAEAELRMKQINAAYSSIRRSSTRGPVGTPRPPRPRPPRPDAQRARSGPSWSNASEPWAAGAGTGHRCTACRTPYPPQDALCPRCFWPNRPNETRRRRRDTEDAGLFAVIVLFALFLLPGLIGAAGPLVALAFIPAVVAIWAGFQLRKHL